MDQVFIQHRFTVTEGDKSYSDALVMPLEDYEKLSEGDIEAQKQQRFDNWKQVIENPVVVEEVPEEKLASLDQDIKSLEDQLVSLKSQKVELEVAIVEEVKEVTPVKMGGK